jgi:hypothetical protein
MGLSEMFWSFLVTSLATCFLATLGFCLKSKCDKIELCCLKIHRAVEIESDVEAPKVELPTFNPTRKPSLDESIHGNKR